MPTQSLIHTPLRAQSEGEVPTARPGAGTSGRVSVRPQRDREERCGAWSWGQGQPPLLALWYSVGAAAGQTGVWGTPLPPPAAFGAGTGPLLRVGPFPGRG